jgi:hypothetical protein
MLNLGWKKQVYFVPGNDAARTAVCEAVTRRKLSFADVGEPGR